MKMTRNMQQLKQVVDNVSVFTPPHWAATMRAARPRHHYMSRGMGFPTMWYVRPAKPQISLRICAV